MNYLFAPSATANNTVRRGDKRNVEGQLLYHTYLITRSQPDPNWLYDDWGAEYYSSDMQKALTEFTNLLVITSMF